MGIPLAREATRSGRGTGAQRQGEGGSSTKFRECYSLYRVALARRGFDDGPISTRPPHRPFPAPRRRAGPYARERRARAAGINVNCPGGLETAMLCEVAYGDLVRQARTRPSPTRESQFEPVEVARVICFLLGDDALIIRGQAVSADGGDAP